MPNIALKVGCMSKSLNAKEMIAHMITTYKNSLSIIGKDRAQEFKVRKVTIHPKK